MKKTIIANNCSKTLTNYKLTSSRFTGLASGITTPLIPYNTRLIGIHVYGKNTSASPAIFLRYYIINSVGGAASNLLLTGQNIGIGEADPNIWIDNFPEDLSVSNINLDESFKIRIDVVSPSAFTGCLWVDLYYRE